MRLLRSLLLLGYAASTWAQQVGAQETNATAQETNTTVGFEYMLEVENVQKMGSTQAVLSVLDGEILGKLQARLPDLNDEGVHLVKFDSIQSEIFNSCFTSSDQCSYIRSTIFVTYQDARPEYAVRAVTLPLVQEYFSDIPSTYDLLRVTYTYPLMVQTLAEFEIHPVSSKMNSTEISVLESTFVEVFGAVVFAIEGDTEVVEARFLYQDIDGNVFSNATDNVSTVTAELRVAGYCRNCTSSQFEDIVVGVVDENLPAFLRELKLNSNASGSTYFDDVSSIVFSIPDLPPPLSQSGDSSIFDQSPPAVETKQPWFLWFGMVMAIIIICGGCYIVIQDTVVYDKDDYSTGDSSHGENGDLALEEDAEGTIRKSNTAASNEEEAGQVEAVASKTQDGNGSNYEVYVF